MVFIFGQEILFVRNENQKRIAAIRSIFSGKNSHFHKFVSSHCLAVDDFFSHFYFLHILPTYFFCSSSDFCLSTKWKPDFCFIESGFLGHQNDAQQFMVMRQIGNDVSLPFPDNCFLLGDKIYPNRHPVMTPYILDNRSLGNQNV